MIIMAPQILDSFLQEPGQTDLLLDIGEVFSINAGDSLVGFHPLPGFV